MSLLHLHTTHTHSHVKLSVSLATPSISGQLVRVASSHTCYGNSQIKCRSIISLSRHCAQQQLTVYWITYQRIKFFGFIWECQMFAHSLSDCLSFYLSICLSVPLSLCPCFCPFQRLSFSSWLVGCLSVFKWPRCLFMSVIDWFSGLLHVADDKLAY